jgi:hypothetical protein
MATESNTATKEPQERKGRLYGRKWKIQIFKPAYKQDENGQTVRDEEHDTAIDVSALRCTFQTKQNIESAAVLCTLVVYNMNAATEGSILTEGFKISIEGGYQEGQYGEIFVGDIVQVFRNRENGIDYRLEIIALKGTFMFNVNHVRSTIAAGSSPRAIAEAVANNADTPMGIGEVSENLKQEALPRGKVLFGQPSKYYMDLCVGNDAHFWQDENGNVTVKKVEDEIPADKCLFLTPLTGLVGTPSYSDDGIHIKMLLDCRVKLYTLIKIDNEIIQRQAVQYDLSGKGNNNQMPQQYQFDQDGEYQVFSVAHAGDTWGDTWTTEVVGIGRNGRQGMLTAVQNANQSTR